MLKAHFDGKAFVPDEPVDLREGTAVRLTFTPLNGSTVLDVLSDLAEAHPIEDSPADWSQRHDDYIRGAHRT